MNNNSIKEDRNSYISSSKEAVKQLIIVLKKKIGDSKSEVLAKKNAFIYAKDIIIDIYGIDQAYNNLSIDSDWYKNSLQDLVIAGRKSKKILEDILKAEIDEKNQTKDIDAKKESHMYVLELLEGIAELEDILKKYDESGDFTMKKKQDFTAGFAERYAE